MKRLEEKFGKPHPELMGARPLHPELQWLQTSFFRLHRRRRVTESGLEPLAFQDITHFANEVIELPRDLKGFFIQIMEATDQAVLQDHYSQRK